MLQEISIVSPELKKLVSCPRNWCGIEEISIVSPELVTTELNALLPEPNRNPIFSLDWRSVCRRLQGRRNGGRMRYSILVLSCFLSACATSSAGLSQMGIEATVYSKKSAQEFATCYAELLQGDSELRGAGNHYWVMRSNAWNVPIVRWDFTDRPDGGSVAELRATAIMGAAKDKLASCA